jgi:Tfp pilus assembly protein PilF
MFMKRLLAATMVAALGLSVASVTACQAKSTKTPPVNVQLKHAIGLLDSYRGDSSLLEEARADLQEVLAADPRNAAAYREMARYFIMNGSINSAQFEPGALESAEAAIDKAIELNPKFAEAFVLRGHLFRLMHRHQDALDALAMAEKLGTQDPWLQNNWADLLIDEGNYEAAAKRYQTVINSGTPNKKAMEAAFQGLTEYYEGVGNLDQAEVYYRKKIEFEPETAWNYGDYGWFLLCRKDDYEGAITRYHQALDRMDYGMARYWLSSALYRKWAQSVLDKNEEAGRQAFLEAQAMGADPSAIAAESARCPPLVSVAQALDRSRPASTPAPASPASGKQ